MTLLALIAVLLNPLLAPLEPLIAPLEVSPALEGQHAHGEARPADGKPTVASKRPGPNTPDLAALQLQVMLDRAGFSPGAIDGRMGPSTERAHALYQQHRSTHTAPELPTLATYVITEMDTGGPFTEEIPPDLMAQASLPALGYRSVVEALAERFHATPELLQRLNPGAAFTAGEMIQVPNVEPLRLPATAVHVGPKGEVVKPEAGLATGTTGGPGTTPAAAPVVKDLAGESVMSRADVLVTVVAGDSRLLVTDATGQVIFSAPVTTGSERDPLPLGEWKVTAIQFNPVFHYNPELFWDANPSHSKARIAPGPNNPVGVVWIDLDKEHYGIHGTPEPASVGRAQSHGCVRLTNWDAVRLASLVKPGTMVHFVK